MSTLFERVPFKTEEPKGPSLLHIFSRNGTVVATVTQYQWYEPDGHEHTGYAELETSRPCPAEDVVARFRLTGAEIALESDDLWNPRWGYLRS